MNSNNLIPIARLNGIVRKRLYSILAGDEIVNPVRHIDRGKECQWLYGVTTGKTNMAASPSKIFDARQIKSDQIVLQNKRSKVEKGGFLKAFGEESNAGSSELGQGQIVSAKDASKQDKSAGPKKRKTRMFRRFMRFVACSPKDQTFGDGPPSICNEKDTVAVSGRGTDCDGRTSKQNVCQQASEEEIADVVKADVMSETPFSSEHVINRSVKKPESLRQEIDGEETGEDFLKDGERSKRGSLSKAEECCKLEAKIDKLEDEGGISDASDADKGQKVPEKVACQEEQETFVCKDKVESDDSLCLKFLFDQMNHDDKRNKKKKVSKIRKSKRKVRKGDQNNEGDDKEGNEDEKEGDECETESRNKRRGTKKPKKLPNYFLALKVDDAVIHEKVKEVQEHIINEEPLFKHVLIAIPTLHLTLLVMRLENEEEIAKAKDALEGSKEIMQNIFKKCSKELTFSGIEHFRNKVVYLGTNKESQEEMIDCLQEAVIALQNELTANGIELKSNGKDKFVPHVTIMKMSKNIVKMKKKGIRHIDPKFYEDFSTLHFGTQKFSELLLCSMLDKKDDDGFYQVLGKIELDSVEEVPDAVVQGTLDTQE